MSGEKGSAAKGRFDARVKRLRRAFLSQYDRFFHNLKIFGRRIKYSFSAILFIRPSQYSGEWRSLFPALKKHFFLSNRYLGVDKDGRMNIRSVRIRI